MLIVALVVQRATLLALHERSGQKPVRAGMPINKKDAVVLLPVDTVRRLLDLAQPGDTAIDDVIKRLAL